MKPNLVIVQSPEIQADALCEKLCEKYYVYLIRPESEFRDDSPAGVRFLNHSLDRLPGFAEVETVISVGDEEIVQALLRAYPSSSSDVWDPFREALPACLKVIKADFGFQDERRLLDAM